MLALLEADFGRFALFIFVLLLLPFCACNAGNPEVYVNESPVVAVSKEISPWGRWGAILPVPEEIVEGLNIGPVFRNSEQEIIIQYKFRQRNANVYRFYNFSKGQLELECENQFCFQEMISSINKIELVSLEISLTKYTLPVGGFRKRISGGSACPTPIDIGYEISLPNRINDYKKILWMSSNVYLFQSSPACNEKLDTSIIGDIKTAKDLFNNAGNILRLNYEKPEYIYTKSIEFNFYSLPDENILGISTGNTAVPVVIIFKNDLTSPFFENQINLFQLDGNLADSIYRVCSAEARLKRNPGQTTLETADACFFEIINNGISDDLKTTFEKKLEKFYVKEETDKIKNNFGGKWGAFLPLPKFARWRSDSAAEETTSIWGVYRNSKNEIIILYSFYIDSAEFWRIFNFSQDKLEYECKVDDEQNDNCSVEKIAYGLNKVRRLSALKTPLGEGFYLIDSINGSYALQGGYEVISPEGDIRYEKIIWISPEKHEYINDIIDIDTKEMNHIYVEKLTMVYYELDEKTLLGHALRFPIIIIFRNDMTSPYFKNNPSLIQIDGKRADSVYYDDCFFNEGNESFMEEQIESLDKCFINFLKGEYSWLQQ